MISCEVREPAQEVEVPGGKFHIFKKEVFL